MGKFSLLTTLVLDASGYNKGIKVASADTAKFVGNMKTAGGAVTDVMGNLGGLTGELAGNLSSMAGAATGVGLVVAAVGALVTAIKKANENMKSFLETANKAEMGLIATEIDAEKKRKEIREKARGQVRFAQREQVTLFMKIGEVQDAIYKELDVNEKARLETLKQILITQYREAQALEEKGKKVREDKAGYLNRIKMEEQIKDILAEQNKIDLERSNMMVEMERLDDEMKEKRKIITDSKTTEAEKDAAMKEYEKKALEITTAKNALIQREIALKERMMAIDGQTQVHQIEINELKMEQFRNEQEYETAILKGNRLEAKVTKFQDQRNKFQEQANKTQEDLNSMLDTEIDKQSVLTQLDEKAMAYKKLEVEYENKKADALKKKINPDDYKLGPDATKEQVEERNRILAENEKTINAILTNLHINYLLERQDMDKEFADKEKEEEKKKLADIYDASMEANKKLIDKKKALIEAAFAEGKISEITKIREIAQLEILSLEMTEEEKRKIVAESEAEILAIKLESIKKEQEARREMMNYVAEGARSILGSINQLYDAEMEMELTMAGENERRKERIRREYAEKKKRMSIIEAIINTAVAMTEAMKLGFPMGLIAAAIMGVAGAAQVAAISSQSFAKGGIVSGPTNALVGEYRGAKTNPEVIAPLSKLQDLLGLSGGGSVKFIIEGDTLVGVLNNYERKIKSYS